MLDLMYLFPVGNCFRIITVLKTVQSQWYFQVCMKDSKSVGKMIDSQSWLIENVNWPLQRNQMHKWMKSRNSWAGLDGKESSCNAGDLGLILGQEDPLEKGMANHSRLLARRILWTEEISELQSMGSQRVGHDWVTYTFRRWSTRKLISELLLLLYYKCLGAIEFSHSWWISPTSFNSNDRNPIQTHLNWNK